MKLTIVYDNTAFRKDLEVGWGFSALVEAENAPSLAPEQSGYGLKILFDTGGDGRILLGNMRKLGIDPSSIDEVFISHPHIDHTRGLSEFLKINSGVKIYVPSSLGLENETVLKQPGEIHKNVLSTGELQGIEQSMAVKTDKGIVLVVGCSHPYMGTILQTTRQFGRLYAVIGGMHGFSEFGLFRDLELICPAHCTQHKADLQRLYPQKYIEGGAGRIIKL
jgi:7,8-dihydropterin-6-yl-methyl-4-(beta-D-ribofuranosyl)aminobenzene 5'-phosphate synthase